MPTRSAATAFAIDMHPEGLHKAVELSKATAAQNLGGEDGLICQSAVTREDGKINVLWKRNWVEPDDPEPEPTVEEGTDEPA